MRRSEIDATVHCSAAIMAALGRLEAGATHCPSSGSAGPREQARGVGKRQQAAALQNKEIEMFCCDALAEAVERGAFYFGAKHRIDDGRIVNDVNTEYFIRAASTRGFDYYGVNYCPFCGRALSLGLWQAEKKK